MSKGDAQRAQNMINGQQLLMQSGQNNLTNSLDQQYGTLANNFNTAQNNYNDAVKTDNNSYSNIMSGYQQLIQGLSGNGGQFSGVGSASSIPTGPGSAYSTFQNFANTGGFSPQDIADIRNQATSPTRSVFANAQQALNRNLATEGYSPNYAAATAENARNLGYTVSSDDLAANAQIAQMIQSGKLSGAEGEASIDEQNAALANSASLARMQGILGAMGGEVSSYGATPGMASSYGNIMLGSGNEMLGGGQELLGAQESQNQIGDILINGQIAKAGVPSDFSQAVGNVGGFLSNIVKPIGGFFSGFGNPFGSSPTYMPGTVGGGT